MLLVENFPGEFAYEYRGEIAVKVRPHDAHNLIFLFELEILQGKGNMLTYWLISGEEASKRSKNSALSARL